MQPSHKRPRDTALQSPVVGDIRQAIAKRTRSSCILDPKPLRWIFVHRVSCSQGTSHETHPKHSFYLDSAYSPKGIDQWTVLKSSISLRDYETYLLENPHVSFVVCKAYSCGNFLESIQKKSPLKPESEAIVLSSVLEQFLRRLPPSRLQGCDLTDPVGLEWPYVHLHHHMKILLENKHGDDLHHLHLDVLIRYLHKWVLPDHLEAQKNFCGGSVRKSQWEMLFPPNETIVVKEHGQVSAYTAASCSKSGWDVLVLRCWSWAFDGKFYRQKKEIRVPWPSSTNETEITNLYAYPLKFAEQGLEARLRQRGKQFWACRQRTFVGYEIPHEGTCVQTADSRYVVDMATYNSMNKVQAEPTPRHELEKCLMDGESLPEEPFVFLLPSTIRAFGFHKKRWDLLQVEHIRSLNWDKESLDRCLSLRDEQRDLVKALVTNHCTNEAPQQTTAIATKTKGLTILLNGAPGTGKTLTASSIAELTERPLYRVTCGDLGPDTKSFEKNLRSTLYFGATWCCIVLLEEADFLLQERIYPDLQQDTLVSRFLTVLENHQGILILTSSGKGGVDEAFRSRIQLVLQFAPLDEVARFKIWQDSIRSLKDEGVDMDHLGILGHLIALARTYRLDGRQIKIAVNNARQLAAYKKETMGYEHISATAKAMDVSETQVLDGSIAQAIADLTHKTTELVKYRSAYKVKVHEIESEEDELADKKSGPKVNFA